MNINRISMIVSDIDGTLLDSAGRLTERTKRALLSAHEAGVHTVIATGRAFTALPEALLQLDSIEYVITSNGTSIFKISDGSRIYGKDMPEALVAAVYDIFCQYTYPVEVFVCGQAYATKAYCENPAAYGNISENYVRLTRQPVEDMDAFIKKHKKHIEGMDIVIDHPMQKKIIRSRLEKLNDIYVTSSVEHYIEVAAGGCSKASALAQLSKLLGVRLSETIAFGDAENDLEMILECGIGAAMKNSCPKLIAAADMTAPSNDDDGVASVLEKLFKTLYNES